MIFPHSDYTALKPYCINNAIFNICIIVKGKPYVLKCFRLWYPYLNEGINKCQIPSLFYLIILQGFLSSFVSFTLNLVIL